GGVMAALSPGLLRCGRGSPDELPPLHLAHIWPSRYSHWVLHRSADCRHVAPRHDREFTRPHLYHRIHAWRSWLCPLLQLYRPLYLLDADVGHGGQPASTLHLLGSRRTLFLFAHRSLV